MSSMAFKMYSISLSRRFLFFSLVVGEEGRKKRRAPEFCDSGRINRADVARARI